MADSKITIFWSKVKDFLVKVRVFIVSLFTKIKPLFLALIEKVKALIEKLKAMDKATIIKVSIAGALVLIIIIVFGVLFHKCTTSIGNKAVEKYKKQQVEELSKELKKNKKLIDSLDTLTK
jgi:flagellar biosynthesis/type III secretory pathway M-ring protein FliF/YscJ